MRKTNEKDKKNIACKKTSQKPEEKEKGLRGREFWATLFPYMKPHMGNIIAAMIFSVITGLCVALQPFVIKYIVDTGIGGKEVVLFEDTALEKVLLRIIGIEGGGSGFLFLEKYTVSFTEGSFFSASVVFLLCAVGVYILLSLVRVGSWGFGLSNMLKALEGTLFTLRSRFFGHVQRMCMRFSDKNSSGELFNYIMGSPMANIKTYLHSMIQSVPYQAVALVISLTALFSYSWKLTILIIATAAVMAFLNFKARTKIRRASQTFLSAEKETSKYITDVLHGSEAIKMYSIEEKTIERFEDYIGNLKETGIHYNMSTFMTNLRVELTQYLGIAAVYLLGGFLCIRGEIEVGELYLFLSTMTTILGILISWLSIVMTHHTASVALERIKRIIEQNSTTPEVNENARRAIEIEKASALRHGKPCISFEHVGFAYAEKPVFSDLNCRIGYNESIGLVGGSGSGKSTFTKLLMRLYEVDEGEIRLHDRNVKDYETHEMRLSFGVVPQNPFIFYGTIWDNIRIVRPEASNKEIIDAMEVARVHEFVNELPMGWSTIIGDGALSLSGGQKQRIAIARAVLKNPDIFIFDEATSALDNISEHLIQEAMDELMKSHTIIFVAHRLSTIRNVNRILVFDHGNIVQEGTYDELAAQEGEFKKLLDAANSVGTERKKLNDLMKTY